MWDQMQAGGLGRLEGKESLTCSRGKGWMERGEQGVGWTMCG